MNEKRENISTKRHEIIVISTYKKKKNCEIISYQILVRKGNKYICKKTLLVSSDFDEKCENMPKKFYEKCASLIENMK